MLSDCCFFINEALLSICICECECEYVLVSMSLRVRFCLQVVRFGREMSNGVKFHSIQTGVTQNWHGQHRCVCCYPK